MWQFRLPAHKHLVVNPNAKTIYPLNSFSLDAVMQPLKTDSNQVSPFGIP